MASANSYCTINLEHLVINIIIVKLRCLHAKLSLVTFIRGVGGKLSRLVYLASPLSRLVYLARPVFGSCSVISQLLLHHNLGIFSCKRNKQYFSQTEMFTSGFQFSYLCPGDGGNLFRLVYLAPHPGIRSGSITNQL